VPAHAPLPAPPQAPLPTSAASRSRYRERFNITSLKKWFKEIDAKQIGQITHKQLIVEVMRKLHHATYGGEHLDDAASAVHVREVEVDATKADLHHLKKVMDTIDGNAILEWPEFLEFFRRSGLLVEYEKEAEGGRVDDHLEHQESIRRESLLKREAMSMPRHMSAILSKDLLEYIKQKPGVDMSFLDHVEEEPAQVV